MFFIFFFQAEDGIRDYKVTGVQTCALPISARPIPRSLVGWPSLTDAERPVVRLVAEGFSNPEIANRLFLSRYTIETHLKRVFAKLGVASRAELAALATAQGGLEIT